MAVNAQQQVLRVRSQSDPADAIRDPDAIRPVVKQWRDQPQTALSSETLTG